MAKDKRKFLRVQGTYVLNPSKFIRIDNITTVEDTGTTLTVKVKDDQDQEFTGEAADALRKLLIENSIVVGDIVEGALPEDDPDEETEEEEEDDEDKVSGVAALSRDEDAPEGDVLNFSGGLPGKKGRRRK